MIFDDKREIVQQGQYYNPSTIPQHKRALAKFLGYDKHGRKTAWGHVGSYLLPFGGSIQNAWGRKAFEGSDAGEVVEAQKKAENANAWNRLAASMEIYKAIAGQGEGFGGFSSGQGWGGGSGSGGGGMFGGMFSGGKSGGGGSAMSGAGPVSSGGTGYSSLDNIYSGAQQQYPGAKGMSGSYGGKQSISEGGPAQSGMTSGGSSGFDMNSFFGNMMGGSSGSSGGGQGMSISGSVGSIGDSMTNDYLSGSSVFSADSGITNNTGNASLDRQANALAAEEAEQRESYAKVKKAEEMTKSIPVVGDAVGSVVKVGLGHKMIQDAGDNEYSKQVWKAALGSNGLNNFNWL